MSRSPAANETAEAVWTMLASGVAGITLATPHMLQHFWQA